MTKQPIILLISGKQGSGKTTLADAVRKHYRARNYPVYRARFADALYDLHYLIWEYMGQFIPKPEVKDGNLLQVLGTEWGRNTLGENVWVDICFAKIKRFVESHAENPDPCIITVEDSRFPNEYAAFPNALRVRLDCPKDLRRERAEMWRENDQHPSEIGLDQHAADGKFDLYLDTSKDIVACLEQLIGAVDRVLATNSKD